MDLNKYQEALDRLNTINMVNFIGDKELIKHKHNDIKTLQELVDKKNPMKVNLESKWKSFDYYHNEWYRCPCCDYKFLEKTFKYCPDCNQKLDWSEE